MRLPPRLARFPAISPDPRAAAQKPVESSRPARNSLSIDADIICLQEVWGNSQTNYAAILAQKLGYHHVHARGMNMGEVFQGNAILSRWPINDSETIKLYGTKGIDENRVAMFADIHGPRGRLPVFCTHLNWKQQHSQIRQRQIVDLANFVQRRKGDGYPPIVCGDFNANPGSDEIRMMTGQTACPVDDLVFHDAWDFAGPGGRGITWDNINPYVAEVLEPDRRIDYIFAGWVGARGAGHILDCRVVGNKPVQGVWASDHHAVMAQLRY